MTTKVNALRKGNHWIETLPITEDLWKKTMLEAQNRVMTLLDSAEKLLDSGGNNALCAGLYTYAVEEYGKILLLKKYPSVSGNVNIKYKGEFRNHSQKFSEASKHLPKECLNLKQGCFDPKYYDPKYYDTETVVVDDLEARTSIFYTDFADSGTEVKSVPTIDNNKLKIAIGELRKITSKLIIP
jgi:AbiV family abortive infection protein